MNSLSIPFFVIAALAVPISILHAGEAPALEISPALLDRLVSEARERNPELQAADARTQAGAAAAAAVRTWEDPTASFSVWSPGSAGPSRSQQGDLVYGIGQKLPLHGLPGLARKVAEADAYRDRLAADYALLKVRRDLHVGLLNVALADGRAALARSDLAWLEATVAEVDHRYRVGQASQVDWLKAQTSRVIAEDALTTRLEEREHQGFAVNRLLNRDLHAPWPEIGLPPLQASVAYTSRLVAAALDQEPQLQVLRQETASAEAAAQLTREHRLPDVSVGLQAWQYSGDGSLKQAMATVSFSVPWLNRGKYDSDWNRDKARRRASDLQAEDYALSVREELHHHVIELDTARRQALLYKEQLIPLTEQTLASAQREWEQGVGTFQDILEAHRMLVADQSALLEAQAKQASLLADLCLLTASRDPATVLRLGAADGPTRDPNHLFMP